MIIQTFLPYSSFFKSAECLDYRRLGKQRVECKQILQALLGVSKGWRNHPATKMWEGYEQALIEYSLHMCNEWIRRGYKDTLRDNYFLQLELSQNINGYEYPKWLGDERLHRSHRSNLLRKDFDYYSKFGWAEPDNLPYWWGV